MYGYIRVCMGMLRWTSGKVVNQEILKLKIVKLEECLIGKVGIWKSSKVDKWNSWTDRRTEGQSDICLCPTCSLLRFSTFHNSHFSNFPLIQFSNFLFVPFCIPMQTDSYPYIPMNIHTKQYLPFIQPSGQYWSLAHFLRGWGIKTPQPSYWTLSNV